MRRRPKGCGAHCLAFNLESAAVRCASASEPVRCSQRGLARWGPRSSSVPVLPSRVAGSGRGQEMRENRCHTLWLNGQTVVVTAVGLQEEGRREGREGERGREREREWL